MKTIDFLVGRKVVTCQIQGIIILFMAFSFLAQLVKPTEEHLNLFQKIK
jgi:hypothetical protein